MAKIAIHSKEKLLKEIELNKTVVIGREKGNIILKNPAVSAKHLKIEKLGERYIIHDLESTNGTFVNEKPVKTKELRSGDIITAGKFQIKFENPDEEPDSVDTMEDDEDVSGMTMMVDPTKLKAMMESDKTTEEPAKLFLYQSSGAPQVMTLEKETTMIGSSENSDIHIKGITIGRVAASITKKGDKYEISYQGGMAKLKVGENPLDRHLLSNGDKFSIGSYNFEFRTKL
jgi:hypothetical protein